MNRLARREDVEPLPSPASTPGALMKLLLCAVSHEWADAITRQSRLSWRLLTAADPVEAMRLMDTSCPSAIVIDGPSADAVSRSCRRLRAVRKCRDAVILAFAGDDPEEVGLLLEAGADDVFVRSAGDAILRARLEVARRTATTLASRRMDEDASEQFFQLSIQLFCIVIDDYFSVVNPAWTQVLGWSSEELTSTPWMEFVHPDDRTTTRAAWEMLRADPPLGVFTNRYRCKDGAYRWLEWRATLSVERDITYAVVHDVTESRGTKEALRELSERLATTLDSIGDGVISTDLTGAVVGMNPVAERLTAWTFAEATARKTSAKEILPLVNGDTHARVESPIDRALRDGVVVSLDPNTFLTRRDGTAIPIADSCAPIRTHDGTVNGAVIVFRDLTAQKSAEAVHALAQKQIIFADRMTAVGTLAAGVAHEINNPLSVVVANVSTALEEIRAMNGALSAPLLDLQRMLVDARAGAERVTKIVRGLKTFSPSDQKPHRVDLLPLLELSIEMAAHQIRQSASLVTKFGEVPLVEAADAQLGQVFVNLLVNAAQAFPAGNEKGNEIRVVTSTDEEGRAVVEVKDTGSGIPPAFLGRIFEPFFTTRPIGSGTGLGLSISRNIVTAMGGDISVESVVGKGTTVRLFLPPSASSASPLSEKRGPADPAAIRRGAILVVDDEPDVCVAIRRILGQHDVTIANDGRTALEVLATGKVFDLVLSDLMMPNMSGMVLFRTIVELYPDLKARVVFITGGAFTSEAHAFLDSVSNERLAKPFSSEELRKAVRRLVG